MRLILARHGETDFNEQDILQGQVDCPLNERGRLQAVALAEALKEEVLDAVYCSDLQRSRVTAEIIAHRHTLPVRSIKEARERSFGVFEGTSRSQFYNRERSLSAPHRHRPENGESFVDLYHRARRFLAMLDKLYDQETVLFVSHGDFSRVCLGILTGKSVQEACQIRQKNCCINILDVKKGLVAKPLILNQIAHLPESLVSQNRSEL